MSIARQNTIRNSNCIVVLGVLAERLTYRSEQRAVCDIEYIYAKSVGES